MSITTGTSIGSYEVTGRLGAGGMGIVYRARDTKLKRDVAIKCLPDTFAEDPDRIARFQREAEVLASLNHPHIGAIYDLQEVGGACFLVLELVEGETLAQRLTRGPIPLDEAIEFSRQIAEALEGAHDKGVIHRDLKPSNIHVTPAGVAKVLDFGLAKVLETPGARLHQSESPTVTSSTPGRVLRGTAAYMSPEQARGQEAGRLSDIWAYGCVLFEMLTGRHAFRGETTSDILGAVLKLEPDWAALPKDTPAGIRRLLHRCLQKDKKRRLHDIADARIELEEATGDTPVVTTDRRPSRAPWIAAAMGLVALSAAGLVLYVRGGASEAVEQRVEINTPPASRQDLNSIAISPDGTKLAFVAPTDRGRQLWLRSLGAIDAKPLPETEGALLPFWSPNSQSIGFFSGSYLKRVDIAGGVVQTLGTRQAGASWAARGTKPATSCSTRVQASRCSAFRNSARTAPTSRGWTRRGR
jgi:serine/threonine protein kinase